VALARVFLKERSTPPQLIGVVCAVVGVALIARG
jgi:drug/metabolite transporter (DMT)-like permease